MRVLGFLLKGIWWLLGLFFMGFDIWFGYNISNLKYNTYTSFKDMEQKQQKITGVKPKKTQAKSTKKGTKKTEKTLNMALDLDDEQLINAAPLASKTQEHEDEFFVYKSKTNPTKIDKNIAEIKSEILENNSFNQKKIIESQIIAPTHLQQDNEQNTVQHKTHQNIMEEKRQQQFSKIQSQLNINTQQAKVKAEERQVEQLTIPKQQQLQQKAETQIVQRAIEQPHSEKLKQEQEQKQSKEQKLKVQQQDFDLEAELSTPLGTSKQKKTNKKGNKTTKNKNQKQNNKNIEIKVDQQLLDNGLNSPQLQNTIQKEQNLQQIQQQKSIQQTDVTKYMVSQPQQINQQSDQLKTENAPIQQLIEKNQQDTNHNQDFSQPKQNQKAMQQNAHVHQLNQQQIVDLHQQIQPKQQPIILQSKHSEQPPEISKNQYYQQQLENLPQNPPIQSNNHEQNITQQTLTIPQRIQQKQKETKVPKTEKKKEAKPKSRITNKPKTKTSTSTSTLKLGMQMDWQEGQLKQVSNQPQPQLQKQQTKEEMTEPSKPQFVLHAENYGSLSKIVIGQQIVQKDHEAEIKQAQIMDKVDKIPEQSRQPQILSEQSAQVKQVTQIKQNNIKQQIDVMDQLQQPLVKPTLTKQSKKQPSNKTNKKQQKTNTKAINLGLATDSNGLQNLIEETVVEKTAIQPKNQEQPLKQETSKQVSMKQEAVFEQKNNDIEHNIQQPIVNNLEPIDQTKQQNTIEQNHSITPIKQQQSSINPPVQTPQKQQLLQNKTKQQQIQQEFFQQNKPSNPKVKAKKKANNVKSKDIGKSKKVGIINGAAKFDISLDLAVQQVKPQIKSEPPDQPKTPAKSQENQQLASMPTQQIEQQNIQNTTTSQADKPQQQTEKIQNPTYHEQDKLQPQHKIDEQNEQLFGKPMTKLGRQQQEQKIKTAKNTSKKKTKPPKKTTLAKQVQIELQVGEAAVQAEPPSQPNKQQIIQTKYQKQQKIQQQPKEPLISHQKLYDTNTPEVKQKQQKQQQLQQKFKNEQVQQEEQKFLDFPEKDQYKHPEQYHQSIEDSKNQTIQNVIPSQKIAQTASSVDEVLFDEPKITTKPKKSTKTKQKEKKVQKSTKSKIILQKQNQFEVEQIESQSSESKPDQKIVQPEIIHKNGQKIKQFVPEIKIGQKRQIKIAQNEQKIKKQLITKTDIKSQKVQQNEIIQQGNIKSIPKTLVSELVSIVRLSNRKHLNQMREHLLMVKEDIRSQLLRKQQRQRFKKLPEVHYDHIIAENIELRSHLALGSGK